MNNVLKIISRVFILPFYTETSFIWILLALMFIAIGKLDGIYYLLYALDIKILNSNVLFFVFLLIYASYLFYVIFFIQKKMLLQENSFFKNLVLTPKLKQCIIAYLLFFNLTAIPTLFIFSLIIVGFKYIFYLKSVLLIFILLVLIFVFIRFLNIALLQLGSYKIAKTKTEPTYFWIFKTIWTYFKKKHIVTFILLKSTSLFILLLLFKFYNPDTYNLKLPIVIIALNILLHLSILIIISNFFQEKMRFIFQLPFFNLRFFINLFLFILLYTLPEFIVMLLPHSFNVLFIDVVYLYSILTIPMFSFFIFLIKPKEKYDKELQSRLSKYILLLLIMFFIMAMYEMYMVLLVILMLVLLISILNFKKKKLYA